MIKVNSSDLKILSNELKDNIKYFDEIGQPIVDEYSKALDEKVSAIRTYLDNIRAYNLDYDIPSLQRMLVDLSTTIYFTQDKFEKLSLLEDFSNIKYKDKYNESYTSRQGAMKQEDRKYTAEQLRALADQEALPERLTNFIYSHSAKIIKSKIDSANELLKAISKILSSKITEMQTMGVSYSKTGV